MNAAQANILPLSEILRKLGCHPQKERGADHWYFSPFRDERTPSFHINVVHNIWYDFGLGRGGDVVDFACAWLESRSLGHKVQDGLRFLENIRVFALFPHVYAVKSPEEEPTLEIGAVHEDLRDPSLIRYLIDDRAIPLDLARLYLLEVEVHNRRTGSSFRAAGMRNADGGYELRNRTFKGCIGHKDVTVLRGGVFPAPDVHVFEGLIDFLSALADQNIQRFTGDMIVLNSLSCLSQALPYIENYESYARLFSWLDNDRAGDKGAEVLRQAAERQTHLEFCGMNRSYKPFKDVNEARIMRRRHALVR